MNNFDWNHFKEQHGDVYSSKLINNGSRQFYDYMTASLYFIPGSTKSILKRFTLSIILSGKGKYTDGSGLELELRPGMIIERIPGEAFSVSREYDGDQPYIEAMFNLTTNTYRSLVDIGLLRNKTNFYEIDLSREVVNDVLSLIYALKYDEENSLASWFCDFISIVKKLRSGNRNNDQDWKDQLVENLKKAMKSNLSEMLNISDFASNLNLSSRYLRKLFLAKTGDSPKNYFLKLKFEHACQLLRHNQLSIKEISYELGYSSPQCFCRQFKKIIGSSPMVYQRNMREEEQA